MFDNYINSIYNGVLGEIENSSKYINIQEINNSSLDEHYLQFIKADIDYLIYKDKLERFAHPNFNFRNEIFLNKINELDDFYRNNALYNKYQLIDLIKNAVQIRLNVLIRPIHSLIWFVYKDELTKPLNEILLKLNYLTDHTHLINKLKEDLLEDNKDNSEKVLISSAEFKHRLVNIDMNFTSECSVSELADTLDELFQFFNLKNDNDELVLPVEALIIFIDDKGYKPLAGFLEKKFLQIPDAKITKKEIIRIFENLEESYNKYQDEDIFNSSVNGFEEQINTFGDNEIADIDDDKKEVFEEVEEDDNEVNDEETNFDSQDDISRETEDISQERIDMEIQSDKILSNEEILTSNTDTSNEFLNEMRDYLKEIIGSEEKTTVPSE